MCGSAVGYLSFIGGGNIVHIYIEASIVNIPVLPHYSVSVYSRVNFDPSVDFSFHMSGDIVHIEVEI